VFLLANVVDDIEMGITDVVRAEEHLPNTPKQQMLWEALGHTPPRWGHVPVLVNEQRKKLSKRRDKVALEQYRDEGYLAEAMVNYLMTLGWTPPGAEETGSEIVSWPEIEAAFRLEDVTHSPAFFDIKKLAAFNGEYIRRMSPEEFVDRAGATLPAGWDRERFAAIAPHIQERLTTLEEVPGKVDFVFVACGELEYDEESWTKAFGAEWAIPLLADVRTSYGDLGSWAADDLKSTLETVMSRYELKLGKAQAPVRVATTGRSVDPHCSSRSRCSDARRRCAASTERSNGLGAAGDAMADRELGLPSDEQRRSDRELIEAVERRLAEGEEDAWAEESPSFTVDPSIRPDPRVSESHDPTPVQQLARRSPWWRRIALAAAVVVAVVVAYGLFSYWQVWSVGRSDQARPVDAIVVLGAAQYDGRPSPSSPPASITSSISGRRAWPRSSSSPAATNPVTVSPRPTPRRPT